MGKFNNSTKLKEILNDERAVEIVKKYLGENVLKNPLINMAKMMTVGKAMAYRKQIGLSDEKADAFVNEIMNLE